MENLDAITFRNDFVNSFPGDTSGDINSRQTPGMFYSYANPTPVRAPKLLAWNEELAAQFGLAKPATTECINILGGNLVAPTMRPYAACYAGHQFGNWAGQLGDGRAITLGEIKTLAGASWELQLKGAGRTAYSRHADGRAVLRSSVREYLMSEAMHYLRVPTTRALSLVSTGDEVIRDLFYNGNPQPEPGAIVARMAPSFLRFGNFEMLAARKEITHLKLLADWTINQFYPHIPGTGEDKILAWYKEVLERTAALMVEWMRVGFVHGVMNTDNMSILGLTIDYGPFSFVDDFDLNFTPNTTDLPGRRYAFGKQAPVAKWNLAALAGAIAPLLSDTKALVEILESYDNFYWNRYFLMMGSKLGLDKLASEKDVDLIQQLERTLDFVKPDMTIFFQLLTHLDRPGWGNEKLMDYFQESFYGALSTDGFERLKDFMLAYMKRLEENTTTPEQSKALMQKVNPRFVPRNYLLHQAIEEMASGNTEPFELIAAAMKEPYSPKFDQFFKKRPDWASNMAGCSMLSCSS